MSASEFDENDPWHANVHLVFEFQCYECDKLLGYQEVPVGDLGENFLEYCVAVSNDAKSHGWDFVEDFKFSCPSCANKRLV